jgi:transposase InsO family protein
MCRALGVSRAGYYAWASCKSSEQSATEAELVTRIRAIHAANRGVYGSPRVHRELRAEGRRVGRHRVARLMRRHRIVGVLGRKYRPRTTDTAHHLPIAPNVLDRRFEVEAPNRAWVTDITYVTTREGWLYLAVVLDLFSRRIVGWSMSDRVDHALTLGALKMAIRTRGVPKGLVHHSDRGCQYAAEGYRLALREYGVVASMSRKGNCWDNAVAESFFRTLKAECCYAAFASRQQARKAIFDFVERFYNRRRRHSSLGYVSPVDFEKMHESRILMRA